jgi:hypothetical protein
MTPKLKGDPMVRAQGRTKPDRNWYPYNFFWYLKWVASFLILISLALRSEGVDYRIYDLALGFVGILLWTWVSIIWRDRALIMLNAISGFMLAVTLLREM